MSWFQLTEMYMRRRQNEILDEAEKGRLAALAKAGRPGRHGIQALPLPILQRINSSLLTRFHLPDTNAESTRPGVQDAVNDLTPCPAGDPNC